MKSGFDEFSRLLKSFGLKVRDSNSEPTKKGQWLRTSHYSCLVYIAFPKPARCYTLGGQQERHMKGHNPQMEDSQKFHVTTLNIDDMNSESNTLREDVATVTWITILVKYLNRNARLLRNMTQLLQQLRRDPKSGSSEHQDGYKTFQL